MIMFVGIKQGKYYYIIPPLGYALSALKGNLICKSTPTMAMPERIKGCQNVCLHILEA